MSGDSERINGHRSGHDPPACVSAGAKESGLMIFPKCGGKNARVDRCSSDRHVVTRNGEFLHVGRVHSSFVGAGDRNGIDQSDSRKKGFVTGR